MVFARMAQHPANMRYFSDGGCLSGILDVAALAFRPAVPSEFGNLLISAHVGKKLKHRPPDPAIY